MLTENGSVSMNGLIDQSAAEKVVYCRTGELQRLSMQKMFAYLILLVPSLLKIKYTLQKWEFNAWLTN